MRSGGCGWLAPGSIPGLVFWSIICLGIIGYASAAGEIVQPLKIDNPSPTPTYVTCPVPYECLLSDEADTKWGAGGHEQSTAGACGFVTVASELKVLMFCYKQQSQPAAGITTTPVPALIPARQVPLKIPGQPPDQVPAYLPGGQVVPAYLPSLQGTGGSPPGRFTGVYPVGFSGLRFNTDGRNSLDLDLREARVAGAGVTVFPDRIEIYQHSSPAVRITFRGDGFTTEDGKISGPVSSADFVTSPLPGTIPDGEISGSVQVVLYALDGRGELTKTIDTNVTPGTEQVFRDLCARNNYTYYATAYVMNISRFNLDRTGSANLTFAVPRTWVDTHGGADRVHIIRISEKDPVVQILNTTVLGADPAGSLVFFSYSPQGTSLFGIITADALAQSGKEPPVGQVMLDLKMLFMVIGIAVERPYLLVIGTVVVLAGFYLRGKKPEQ